MAVNIRPEYLITASEEVNKEFPRYEIGEIQPSTGNANLTGDIHFDITTGQNQYLDLFKLNLLGNIALTYAAGTMSPQEMLISCFNRAQLYINGYLVATSNNIVNDYVLNLRSSFSQVYNENNHNFTAPTDANIAAGTGGQIVGATTVAFTYSAKLFAVFSIMHPGLILPPNSQMKIILSASSDAIIASRGLMKTNTACTAAVLSNLRLKTYTVSSPKNTPSTYQMTLITPDSFRSTPTATTNLQYTSKNHLVRVSANLISNTSSDTANAAAVKSYTHSLFRYVTDYTLATAIPAATSLTSLQFKVGSQMLPQNNFNTVANFAEFHEIFNSMHDGDLDPAGGESLNFYLARGPIYSVPVVRTSTDHPKTIEVAATFVAAPAAWMYVTLHYEQILTFNYGAMGEPTGFSKIV